MIRTINERLRTNRKIIISKDKNGISNILFALRSEKGPDGKSAFEKQNGRKPNTEKSRMIEKCILEQDPQIEIEPEGFSEEADSTILVRERVRGTKLEGAFKKVKGKIVGESSHTITVLPKTGHQVIYSKRDVAAGSKRASPNKKAITNKMANCKREASETKEAKSNKVAKKLKTAIGQEMGISYQKQVEENKQTHHEEEEKTTIQPVKEEQDNEERMTHRDQEEQTATANSGDETESAEKSTLESTPIQGTVKWEKSRTSSRVTKKPDRWGNNVMIAKIEPDSANEEESLPSVMEIPNPKEKLAQKAENFKKKQTFNQCYRTKLLNTVGLSF